MSTEARREFYPHIEPYFTGFIQVSDIHNVYYEQSGNPEGKPVMVLHGGPGGGSNTKYRQFFNPEKYRIVQFDQRGCGKSTPTACVKENTTWDLVEDIERIRKELKIERMVVFGGSWGSTLSLTYAETHPDRVIALVLRGIFTLRRDELIWFYQKGANNIFPEAWEKFIAPIPEVERDDFMSAYYRYLTGDDEEMKLKCAQAWSCWEMATSRLYVDPQYIARAAENDTFATVFATIESHYFVHGGFYKEPNQVLNNAHILKDIPGTIVQGRYDVVCPTKTSYELHKKLPHFDYHIIPDAGHSCIEPGIISELVKATDKYASLE